MCYDVLKTIPLLESDFLYSLKDRKEVDGTRNKARLDSSKVISFKVAYSVQALARFPLGVIREPQIDWGHTAHCFACGTELFSIGVIPSPDVQITVSSSE